jgi:SAM-dependent methyltransferase
VATTIVSESTTAARGGIGDRPDDAPELDRRNEEFWDELCGSGFAQALGLTGRDQETLAAFDRAYFGYYPYLSSYLDRFPLAGRPVLEIGLGYGTLGQEIVRRGAHYFGLDIAAGPVRMMRHRMDMLGVPGDERIVQGSAAAIPFEDATFDYVYTIGCLHHTGALAKSVEEVRRVLVPGGSAVVMLYHADSARQLLKVRLPTAVARLRGRSGPSTEEVIRLYDADTSGAAAPHTDFVSRRTVRDLFRQYTDVRIETRNFDDLRLLPRMVIPRRRLLGSPIERWFGLDLYVVARR